MIGAMATRVVIIHSLDHARAALAAAAALDLPVTLLSASGAAAYAGAGWFDAVLRQAAAAVPSANFTAVLDCGDRADLVQAALRQGLRNVAYAGPKELARRLADIAGAQGATLHLARPEALDLRDVADPERACRDWLAGRGN